MQNLPFTLEGQVVSGKQLGRKLGFPTANIAYDPSVSSFPKEGVYVASVVICEEGCIYPAILNQGRHPTAPGGPPTIEAHLLGYPADDSLYGRRIDLTYLLYLRPERSFPSLQALQAQLREDREAAVAYAAEHPDLFSPTVHFKGANR